MKKIFYILLGIIALVGISVTFYTIGSAQEPRQTEKLSLRERLQIIKDQQAGDIKSYLSGVAQIQCDGTEGSGSLWKISGDQYMILTNDHVIENPVDSSSGLSCYVWVHDKNHSVEGVFQIFTSEDKFQDAEQDIALLPLHPVHKVSGLDTSNMHIKDMNYIISGLAYCPVKTEINSPVFVIGYPSSGSLDVDHEAGTARQDFRILTTGIVSGYDSSITNSSQGSMPDFFISAKLDSGNSGGIALSKYNEEFCILGVPTWVNIGDYDTQGVVQNINSINI